MVAPFPPLRDGVGRYAEQEVVALRAEGHTCEVLAPVACAAHHVENFRRRGMGLRRLRKYSRRYDSVILQYQPAHYHRQSRGFWRVLSSLGMVWTFWLTRNLTIVCHEVEYPPNAAGRFRPAHLLERLAWRSARHVEFHTSFELEQMERRMRIRPRSVSFRDHGRTFAPAVVEDRKEARRRLGIPDEVTLLLCIGFIQRHKGFDRAIRAFRKTQAPGARLVVIGSLREELPEHQACLEGLRVLAAPDDRVEVIERALSDEAFDRWIAASDVVLLPYLEIWSSGVLERAKLMDRPVIASRVGGMPEQTGDQDELFDDEEGLAEILARRLGGEVIARPTELTAEGAIEFVQREVARRRGEGTSVDRVRSSLMDLYGSMGVHPVVLPSQRRFVGRLITLMKRVAMRLSAPVAIPIMGQVNEFERATLDAFKAVVAELRHADPGIYSAIGYPMFEERFRGHSDELRRTQRERYLAHLEGCDPVLDIGCGRGEFLEVLREAGIEAKGVDLDADSVEACREKGLAVDQGDAVPHLRSLSASSLGGVFAAQVIEHMPLRAILDLLTASFRALRPGGVLVLETINPQSLYALANWYVMDMTHVQPVHPETLEYLAEQHGFVDTSVHYSSELHSSEPAVEAVPDDAPGWASSLVTEVNAELEALSNVVFAPADYALIARVPAAQRSY